MPIPVNPDFIILNNYPTIDDFQLDDSSVLQFITSKQLTLEYCSKYSRL